MACRNARRDNKSNLLRTLKTVEVIVRLEIHFVSKVAEVHRIGKTVEAIVRLEIPCVNRVVTIEM